MHNIMFGIFHSIDEDVDQSRCETRIRIIILDLRMLEEKGYLQERENERYFNQAIINKFRDVTRKYCRAVTEGIVRFFRKVYPIEAQIAELSTVFIHRAVDVKMELPATIGDYRDFD